MKIGILTHHYVGNFGAVLQTDALVRVLKENCGDAEIEVINYKVLNHYFRSNSRFFHYKKEDTYLSYIRKLQLFKSFHEFRKSLPIGKPVKDAHDINKQNYSLIIVGSDEVWNYDDQAYSPIKFGVDIKCPHITYSASIGGSSISDSNIPQAVKLGIPSFMDIAVRDKRTNELVKKITHKDVIETLDPVYLYDYKLKVSEKILKWVEKKPYILIYDCKLTITQVQLICSYAEKNEYNILGAGEYQRWYTTTDTINVTPYEWIYLFKNALGIITGTFHGTSFAIKYNKPFAAYLTETNRANKVSSILSELGLESRIVASEDNILDVLMQNINYSKVNYILNLKRQKSIGYLQKNLNIIQGKE